jgi:co-chaperonin GroES (HSP10)
MYEITFLNGRRTWSNSIKPENLAQLSKQYESPVNLIDGVFYDIKKASQGAKIYNYEGRHVEVRPRGKRSTKFIVWDVLSDQIFANETFDSKKDAENFVALNKMVLSKSKTDLIHKIYILSETISGEGYSEPTFSVYRTKEEAKTAIEQRVFDLVGDGYVISEQADNDVSLQTDAEGGDIADDYTRLKIFEVPGGENRTLIEYSEPNEVAVTTFPSYKEAKAEMDKRAKKEKWDDKDEVDDNTTSMQIGGHAYDGYVWFQIVSENDAVNKAKKGTKVAENQTDMFDTSGVKYRAEVGAVGESRWSGNAMEYDTSEEAKDWLRGLASRWFGYNISRVVPVSTPTNQDIDLSDPSIFQNYRKNAKGTKIRTNSVAVKELIKDLENTPHGVGLALLRERLLAHAEYDLSVLKKNPKTFQNPVFSVGMYEDLFNRIIKELSFDTRKNNDKAVKDLIKDLANTPHEVGLGLLRERIIAYAENDIEVIKKQPKTFDNPIFSHGMYKDLFTRMIKFCDFGNLTSRVAEQGMKTDDLEEINVSVYKWGEYSMDDKIDLIDLPLTELTSEMLEGFTIRPEDEGKHFYASENDIDDTNVDEEGYGIKWAYATTENHTEKAKRGTKIRKSGFVIKYLDENGNEQVRMSIYAGIPEIFPTESSANFTIKHVPAFKTGKFTNPRVVPYVAKAENGAKTGDIDEKFLARARKMQENERIIKSIKETPLADKINYAKTLKEGDDIIYADYSGRVTHDKVYHVFTDRTDIIGIRERDEDDRSYIEPLNTSKLFVPKKIDIGGDNIARRGAKTETQPIISKNGWVLVDETTNRPIRVGDLRKDFRGDNYKVLGGQPPQHSASQGKVWQDEYGAMHYASVIGAKWVKEPINSNGDEKAKQGAKTGTGFMVFNYTDNIYASPDVFSNKTKANDFIAQFRKRFEGQGYYRDNNLNKIAPKDIDLLAIPTDFNPFKKN